MYKYKLSFEAEEEVIRIFEYGLKQFGFQQANKYYEMLYDCFDRIASNP
jgi:toxin ParE1/3/4